MKVHLTHNEVAQYARRVAQLLFERDLTKAYPIPRGGIPAAYAVLNHSPDLQIVETPEEADCYIDDIIDSGKTRERFNDKPFFALIDKTDPGCTVNGWVVFPWEGGEVGSAEDICTRLLQFIGEDPTREGLRETPARFLKAWKFWTSGYKQNPADVMKVFEDGGENYNEMVLVKDIPLYSFCEHHLAQIVGFASVAYVPDGKIIGLSKIARVVNIFARRLQVQERLTSQIADCLVEHLNPLGVGVIITARHMCMESRGVERPGAVTVTSALRGCLHEGPARSEFLELCRR